MNILTKTALLAVMTLPGAALSADGADPIANAQRIVVITATEGIHFAAGCAFYEMRDLVAAAAQKKTESGIRTNNPVYELRVLGKDGERIVFIGQHWIKTDQVTAPISAEDYSRFVGLVEKRQGQGVPMSRIKKSVRTALKKISDPAYKEVNRCVER